MRIRLWVVLISLSLAGTAAAQSSAPGKAPRAGQAPATSSQTAAPVVAPRPSPVPTPTPVSPGLSSAPILTGPKYSPTQLDFGAIDYAASSRRTFSLTVPAAGEVTLEFPAGSFVAAELRRVPPINLGGKWQMTRAAVPPMKPVPASNIGQTEIYKWNFTVGEEMQLDILFAPSFSKDKNPGLRSAIVKFSGPATITPWTAMIPMRGTVNGQALNLAPSSSQAPLPAAKSPATANPALTPSNAGQAVAGKAVKPTPTPVPPPMLGTAQVLNKPVYLPNQFDFGEVWDGDLARKTFHITANASGMVTVDIPAGPFHVSEFREMGKATGGSKNMGTGKGPVVPYQPVKIRYPYPDGRTGPLHWQLEPGAEAQIDVVFQPHFQFGGEMAGLKTTTMKVTGPGPHGNWALSVPVSGMFDGLKVHAPITADEKDIYAVDGDEGAYVDLTIAGLGTAVTGTIKAGSLVPPGVSIPPLAVSVPAKASTKARVWVAFGKTAGDGKPRPLELVFESSNGSSKTQILVTILPEAYLKINSGDRGDCGVSRASLSLQISPPHQSKSQRTSGGLSWVFLGLNFDVVDKRYVEMTAQSGGVQLFAPKTFVLPERMSDEFRQNSPYVTKFDVTTEEWAGIIQGPAQFGCRQWEVSHGGAIVPKGQMKWTDAVQGLKF